MLKQLRQISNLSFQWFHKTNLAAVKKVISERRRRGIIRGRIVWFYLILPTKAFTLVCRPIHKHFGGDDITERQEHLHQLAITKLLREVIDEQVTALRPCAHPANNRVEEGKAETTPGVGWGG